jgi:hypothetical protein
MWRQGKRSSYFVYHPAFLAEGLEPFPLIAPKRGAINKAFISEDKRMYQQRVAVLRGGFFVYGE